MRGCHPHTTGAQCVFRGGWLAKAFAPHWCVEHVRHQVKDIRRKGRHHSLCKGDERSGGACRGPLHQTQILPKFFGVALSTTYLAHFYIFTCASLPFPRAFALVSAFAFAFAFELHVALPRIRNLHSNFRAQPFKKAPRGNKLKIKKFEKHPRGKF